MGHVGAVALAKALESGKCSLMVLNLGCETNDRACACASVDCAAMCNFDRRPARALGNRIGDAGAIAMATVLRIGICGLATLCLGGELVARTFTHFVILRRACMAEVLGMPQTTGSATRAHWPSCRHCRVATAVCRR